MRLEDINAIKRLQRTYGYYLDKNLWTDLADLFAKDGSIELAQRGVYKGPRVREFLFKVFGRGAEEAAAFAAEHGLTPVPATADSVLGEPARAS